MCVFPLNVPYPFFPTPLSSSVFMPFLLSLFVVYLLSLFHCPLFFGWLRGQAIHYSLPLSAVALQPHTIPLKTHRLQTGEQAVTGSLNCASHTNKHEKNMSHWCILNLHYVSFMPKSLSCVAPKLLTFFRSELFVAGLHMVTILLLCMRSSSQLKPDRKDSVWFWPCGCPHAPLPLHPSICPCLLISSSVVLLRSGQVVLTLKKQCSCREQPAQAWPPSPVFSISFLISWLWY